MPTDDGFGAIFWFFRNNLWLRKYFWFYLFGIEKYNWYKNKFYSKYIIKYFQCEPFFPHTCCFKSLIIHPGLMFDSSLRYNISEFSSWLIRIKYSYSCLSTTINLWEPSRRALSRQLRSIIGISCSAPSLSIRFHN